MRRCVFNSSREYLFLWSKNARVSVVRVPQLVSIKALRIGVISKVFEYCLSAFTKARERKQKSTMNEEFPPKMGAFFPHFTHSFRLFYQRHCIEKPLSHSLAEPIRTVHLNSRFVFVLNREAAFGGHASLCCVSDDFFP